MEIDGGNVAVVGLHEFPHTSYRLNSLKGFIWGIIEGSGDRADKGGH